MLSTIDREKDAHYHHPGPGLGTLGPATPPRPGPGAGAPGSVTRTKPRPWDPIPDCEVMEGPLPGTRGSSPARAEHRRCLAWRAGLGVVAEGRPALLQQPLNDDDALLPGIGCDAHNRDLQGLAHDVTADALVEVRALQGLGPPGCSDQRRHMIKGFGEPSQAVINGEKASSGGPPNLHRRRLRFKQRRKQVPPKHIPQKRKKNNSGTHTHTCLGLMFNSQGRHIETPHAIRSSLTDLFIVTYIPMSRKFSTFLVMIIDVVSHLSCFRISSSMRLCVSYLVFLQSGPATFCQMLRRFLFLCFFFDASLKQEYPRVSLSNVRGCDWSHGRRNEMNTAARRWPPSRTRPEIHKDRGSLSGCNKRVPNEGPEMPRGKNPNRRVLRQGPFTHPCLAFRRQAPLTREPPQVHDCNTRDPAIKKVSGA